MLFISQYFPVAAEPPDAALLPIEAQPINIPWETRREQLRLRLAQRPPVNVTIEETAVHFLMMPAHYWERVTEADLVWGLETIHGFLKVVASPALSSTAPFVSWRQTPGSNCTRVMLCTWDRQGLLAKAAAAFSAVRLNILHAGIFTRSDNIVLDEFTISDANGRGAVNETRMQEMAFLLEGALSEPPRFASVWACSRHKYLGSKKSVPPRITFDSTSSPDSTAVNIQTPDRLGLLYDILQTISDAGLNVRQARIETEGQFARDTIHLVDERNRKLEDGRRLESLRASLDAALTVGD